MINPLKFAQEVKQELFKITWPTRKDVMVGSLMVFVLATIAAIFFLILDQIYKFLLDFILEQLTLQERLHYLLAQKWLCQVMMLNLM